MKESEFVQEALAELDKALTAPLKVRQKAALLYQVTVNNRLRVEVDPRWPVRGQSAFETDVCVLEETREGIEIPRVVVEFKSRITTHGVMTYSAKAQRHRQVYPYLRYGLVIGGEKAIPGRVFTHNEHLDFCLAAAGLPRGRLYQILVEVLRDEVAASRSLERILFGAATPYLVRSVVVTEFHGDY